MARLSFSSSLVSLVAMVCCLTTGALSKANLKGRLPRNPGNENGVFKTAESQGAAAEPSGYRPTEGQDPHQRWDYVNVRPSAYMFWWLYMTTHPAGYTQRPLVIWLQGGPGASSTGFGNFMEIGPQDVDLKPRNQTWLREVNLLFVDNPVGTGFSYVTDDAAYVTDNAAIAKDLMTMMKHFLGKNPEFQTTPVYIFSESYGGKMTAEFAQSLQNAVESGSVKCNFKGLAMGDSWISPLDSVLTWGPYLYTTSLIDGPGLEVINEIAMEAKSAIDKGLWENATQLWADTENLIALKTDGVNLYNILKWGPSEDVNVGVDSSSLQRTLSRLLKPFAEDKLTALMNGPIRKKLGNIPHNVTWGGQSNMVFSKLNVDFMKPVISVVDSLLLKPNLKVVVYSGQLDLIVDTMGTVIWVQRLSWPDLNHYDEAIRSPMLNQAGTPVAFKKAYKNFSFYWILDAGHMIPADQPATAMQMLRDIVG